MSKANLEKKLEKLTREQKALAEQQRANDAKRKQVEAQLRTAERKKQRAWENHTKAVLGGAIFGILKNHNLPDDRKCLQLYGNAVRDVFRAHEPKLVAMIERRYAMLLQEHQAAAKEPEAATEAPTESTPMPPYE